MLDATINQETFFAFVHLYINVEHRERKTHDLKLIFVHIIWWWQFWWREEWTPDSISRLGWEVNNRSIYEDESVKIWVGSLINCCKPNWDVTRLVLDGWSARIKL